MRTSGRGSRSFGILSTFPPTPCGIATFSAALAAGLVGHGHTVDVVRADAAPAMEDPLVVAALHDAATGRIDDAVDVLNHTDVAVVQHEYGIYGGVDGANVVALLEAVVVPKIVVAHTVLRAPSPSQRLVLESVCAQADVVVVMTHTARERLLAGFDVDPEKIVVVPHGAATPPSVARGSAPNRRPRLLTWGLLGPGKGIEWAVDATAQLVDLQPDYLIAGATHPKVLARSGESYRQMLIERVQAARLASFVSFDDSYRDLASLTELIRSADLVVLPYDSQDQVTSGVLVDAVAAGRPVVATAFPHAVELLGSGAGIVVPQRDPDALAAAIRAVLSDRSRARSMENEACRLAPGLSWRAVAGRYDDIASAIIGSRHAVRA
jgi:polysaccharide biosynthesis protein PslF